MTTKLKFQVFANGNARDKFFTGSLPSIYKQFNNWAKTTGKATESIEDGKYFGTLAWKTKYGIAEIREIDPATGELTNRTPNDIIYIRDELPAAPAEPVETEKAIALARVSEIDPDTIAPLPIAGCIRVYDSEEAADNSDWGSSDLREAIGALKRMYPCKHPFKGYTIDPIVSYANGSLTVDFRKEVTPPAEPVKTAPEPVTPPEPVHITKVVIHWSEASSVEEKVFTSARAAMEEIRGWYPRGSADLPKIGYDKTKCSIYFSNGDSYDNMRLDISSEEDNPFATQNIFLEHREQWVKYLNSEKAREYYPKGAEGWDEVLSYDWDYVPPAPESVAGAAGKTDNPLADLYSRYAYLQGTENTSISIGFDGEDNAIAAEVKGNLTVEEINRSIAPYADRAIDPDSRVMDGDIAVYRLINEIPTAS